MKRVTIVGAGVAGMSAALKLLERGFDVILYEQDDFVGGMLRSYEDDVTTTRREHSYHMFPNFYFNFWTIAEQLGLQDNFTPREAFRFLRHDDLANLPAIFNPGGPQQFLRNLASYAVPAPDMFIYMYSMIDMLSEPPEKDDLMHKISVNGFLHSRPYMTATAAQLHQTLWETVWAISSYQASLSSYRTFVKYTNRYSVPELWLLAGNKWDYLMKPWLEKLESYGERFQLHKRHRLERVEPNEDGTRIEKLHFVIAEGSPSVDKDWKRGPDVPVNVANDEVILSVTPGMMADLVEGDLFEADPDLGQIRYLQSEPMGALQLYLNRRIPDMPDDVTDFENAPYYMTFLDYTQLWPDQEKTFIYVTCSDVITLLSLREERRDKKTNLLEIDLEDPKSALEFVLREVVARLPITLDDVDRRKTAFDMNTGEELFANLVGSWDRRPETETSIHNLYLAGTYVRNEIDVATIEGAVVTGLQAAEAIRKKVAPRADEVTVLHPEAFPRELFMSLKVAWAPLAAAAKVWSESNSFMSKFGPGWEEMQKRFIQAAAKALQPLAGPLPNPPEYLGRLNWQVAALNLPADSPLAVGPLYWNYDRDGRLKQPTQGSGTGRTNTKSGNVSKNTQSATTSGMDPGTAAAEAKALQALDASHQSTTTRAKRRPPATKNKSKNKRT